jgi:hypothetical protein
MSAIEWTNTAGGDWGVAGNWSSGTLPGAADDVSIDIAGPYTATIDSAEAAHSLSLGAAGATVQLNNTLTLGTTLDVTAGSFDLDSGGRIAGGTILGAGLVFAGGTLSGVTYDGTLDLSATGAEVHVNQGITLTGAGGSGPGTVLLIGYRSELYFNGSQTLDSAYIGIGGRYGYDPLAQAGTAGTLTLGPGLAINQVRTYAELAVAAGNTIVNGGTIDAALGGGRFLIAGGGNFTNQGTIAIANGDQMVVDKGITFANLGTIALASGAQLDLKDNLATSALGSLTDSGAALVIQGTLINTGNVLATGSSGLGVVLLDGVIVGGTITGGEMYAGGTLSGVTYAGTLDLSNGYVNVINGITLTGTGGSGLGSVMLGYFGNMHFLGTQTFDNAAVSIGSEGFPSVLQESGSRQGGTLTLGPHLTITQTGIFAELYAGGYDIGGIAIVNRGTIDAAVSGGYFAVKGPGGIFTNEGTITVGIGDNFIVSAGVTFSNLATLILASGSTLTLDDNFLPINLGALTNSGGTLIIGGTLTNTGHVLATGTGGLGTVALSGGAIVGGTITGSEMLFQVGTLSGITYDGTIDLSVDSSRLTISNGINLAAAGGIGPASVLLTGQSSYLEFPGTQSFDNAVVSIGATAGFASLEGSGLTLGPNLTIMQVGLFADLSGGAIVNYGTIDAGVSGGEFGIFWDHGSLPELDNQGLVSVSNGDTLLAGSFYLESFVPALIYGSGTIALAGGGVASLSGVGIGQIVDFLDATGRLALYQPAIFTFAGVIDGFQIGDTIDLGGFVAVSDTFASNSLVLTDAGDRQATLNIVGNFTTGDFILTNDGSAGTFVSVDRTGPAPRDFEGNGTSDILWRGADGNVAIWEMNGLSVAASGLPGFADPTNWTIAGTGDFDGDGRADILWRDAAGDVAIWDMNGTSVAASGLAGFADPAAWSIEATGDFNGDGQSDILWRGSDGNVAVWEINDNTVAAAAVVGFADPTAWSIKGTGDFNGDGLSDILWQDQSGDVDIWEMNGTSIAASGLVTGATAAAGWTIRGTGDFNGDGMSDILWQDQSGDVAIWEMSGFSVAASAIVGFADPTAWHIAGVGDYNGDGKSDILWQDTSGDVAVWQMNGLSIAASGLVGFADPASWHIIPPDNTGAVASG